MRSCLLVVLVTAACADSGAHLTFVAPDGPTNARGYRVVLATPDRVELVAKQRTDTGPTSAEQSVPYYFQRTIAGQSREPVNTVDGLTVRIAPEGDFEDWRFIPFVLFYDASDAIVGIGTYREGADPAGILVLPDEIDKYEIIVEPVTQVSDTEHPAPGQVMVVDCYRDDQSTFTSGIVWRPKAGGELRLLFPDDDRHDPEADALDATGRMLDLDCDAYPVAEEVSRRDCDDSRAWFHTGAEETCDGYDTNCDGQQTVAVACPGTGNVCVDGTTSSGIAICDEGTASAGACQSDPGCLCAANPSTCTRCRLSYEPGFDPGKLEACNPGVGLLGTLGYCEAAPCTVSVLGVRPLAAVSGPWKVEVAAPSASPAWGPSASSITTKFMIKATSLSSELTAMPGDPIGEVDLLVTSGTTQHYLGVQLETLENSPGPCVGTNGAFAMECTP